MRFMLLLVAMLVGAGDRLAAQEKVEAQGITQTIKLEEVVYGHLTELNGKFKLRATEVTFAPGAHLGAHHHVGPGIRYVLSGEVTFTEGGQATVYKAGDYFLSRETSCIPLGTIRNRRWSYCLWKFCPRIGTLQPLFHPSCDEPWRRSDIVPGRRGLFVWLGDTPG